MGGYTGSTPVSATTPNPVPNPQPGCERSVCPGLSPSRRITPRSSNSRRRAGAARELQFLEKVLDTPNQRDPGTDQKLCHVEKISKIRLAVGRMRPLTGASNLNHKVKKAKNRKAQYSPENRAQWEQFWNCRYRLLEPLFLCLAFLPLKIKGVLGFHGSISRDLRLMRQCPCPFESDQGP